MKTKTSVNRSNEKSVEPILKEFLNYYPISGMMFWKERPRHYFANDRSWATWNTRYAGKEAGNITNKGYRRVGIRIRSGGKQLSLLAHRIAFFMKTGNWPVNQVDHINGDKSDNRFENLRDATATENQRNKQISVNNTSGVVGVTFNRAANKWQSQIMVGEKNLHLGIFTEKDAAIAARKAAEIKYSFHQNHGRAAV